MDCWAGSVSNCRWIYTRGVLTSEGWDWYIQRCMDAIRQSGRTSLLTIARERNGAPSVTQRKQLADVLNDNYELTRMLYASALVFDAPTQRRGIDTINLLSRKPYPETVFDSIRPAVDWLAGVTPDLVTAELLDDVRSTVGEAVYSDT